MESIFFDIHCSKIKENIDTNTPQGRFVLSIFAALSELEREQTLQRQREGIAIAKSQGKYKSRQPIPIDWDKFGQLYEQWKSGTIPAVWFQKEMRLLLLPDSLQALQCCRLRKNMLLIACSYDYLRYNDFPNLYACSGYLLDRVIDGHPQP